MDWIRNYQLFLFDFDGLLVDTEPYHYTSYAQMCRKRGCAFDWDFERFCHEAHGKALGIWDALGREFPQMFEKESREVLYEDKKRIYVELLKEARLGLMEGIEPLLLALEREGIKRAVVTNSPRFHIEIIQRSLPVLRSIPLWITREDYAQPKPAPDGYLKAIEKLARPEDRIIGFEDTMKGLKSLIAAGVEAVLICPKEHPHVKECASLGARHFNGINKILL